MTPVSLVRLCDVMRQLWLIQQCFVCFVSVKCIIHLFICFKTDSKCSIRHVYIVRNNTLVSANKEPDFNF